MCILHTLFRSLLLLTDVANKKKTTEKNNPSRDLNEIKSFSVSSVGHTHTQNKRQQQNERKLKKKNDLCDTNKMNSKR